MRLIDADAVDDVIQTLNENGWHITRDEYKRIDRILFEIPTVDAVKHGHWEIDEKRYGNKDPHCSICRAILEGDADKCRNNYYCYHCGAKMDEVKDGLHE